MSKIFKRSSVKATASSRLTLPCAAGWNTTRLPCIRRKTFAVSKLTGQLLVYEGSPEDVDEMLASEENTVGEDSSSAPGDEL